MSKLQLNTRDESLREILGNAKKYVVPKFQRDYSWESKQLETLWEDIEEMVKDKKNYHYMGYLVLQQIDTNKYKIIDGQQRLTTFSLFVLACIKRLKTMEKKQENKRAEFIFRSFIGVEEFDGIYINRKLTLNINNDDYYNEATKGNEIPKTGRTITKTVRLMRKAIDYFYSKIENKTGEQIGQLIENISNQLLFTTIYIGDELNAYKVFETLNARGVQLSSADLLKNHLFSLLDREGNIPVGVVEDLNKQWSRIGTNIGDRYYTDYILCQWNSSHKMVRKSNLFTAIRKEINNPKFAKEYLNIISDNSTIYEGITNAESDFFKSNGKYKDIKKHLSFLRLFNIKQPFSLLLIAYQEYPNDFAKILKWIQVFSLRYNIICNQHAGEQMQLYNKICLQISKGCSLQDIKSKLLDLYPSDEKFKQNFAHKTMLTSQSNKKAKYLLARLAEYESKNPIDESTLTIEYILPLNPNEQWVKDFGDHWDSFTQRIGNMALVTQPLNDKLGQESFTQKQQLLKDSYAINDISDYEDWTSQEVESRQQRLAEISVNLWKID